MRRRWIWIAFASLCALTLLLGWLSQPTDRLAFLDEHHPRKFGQFSSQRHVGPGSHEGLTFYDYPADCPQLLPILEERLGASHRNMARSSREWEVGDCHVELLGGVRQEVEVRCSAPTKSWLQARWDDVKKRLGW